MSAKSTSLLVLANSGRAIAESAHRGGYRVTLIDGFCDQDTLAVADCWPITQGFSNLDVEIFVKEIASLFPDNPCGVVYGAGLEESTSLLRRLSEFCHLFGNDPSVLELLCRPQRFFSLLDRLQIAYPDVSLTAPYSATERSWLIKRAASCGGQGVAYFSPEYAATDSACYYQRFIPGQVMSVLFIADGKGHHTIGYNTLGIAGSGVPAPFLYSGAIGQACLRDVVRSQVELAVIKLVSELGLRGINSLDFVHNDASIFVIDLNPRPTATLDLYEHLLPDGWIKRHIAACCGELPEVPNNDPAVMHGHQIIYAPRNIEIPNKMSWPQWVSDRPPAGNRIVEGQPLCSLYAKGANATEVEAELHTHRDEVLWMLGPSIYPSQPCQVAV
ncbi:MAG: ATP-grasp domain-containing protein [Candidatus Thiodiazotropha endolucinida]